MDIGASGETRRRRGQRGPTLADVARMAGVSPMTVSRVVNGTDLVVEETRKKVLSAVDALGYVPNQAARSLAGGRQCKIALLYSNPSASYLSEFLVGSLAAASDCDAQIVVEQCSSSDTPESLVDRLTKHRANAVLLPPPLCDDEALLTAFRKAKLPFAQIATGKPAPGAIAVTMDDEAAARSMTERLIAQGHVRIGFIAGNTNQTTSALRRAGYEKALLDAGIEIDPALIEPGDFSYRSGMLAAEALLARTPRPNAIFASNDDMAAAAVAVAHRLGLDVPGDIAICGYDDTALATAIWPELTTIRQPVAEMARTATKLLYDLVALNIPPQDGAHVCLKHELVVRNSDQA